MWYPSNAGVALALAVTVVVLGGCRVRARPLGSSSGEGLLGLEMSPVLFADGSDELGCGLPIVPDDAEE